MLNDTDPSSIVQQRVAEFADKYKSILTLKEYNHLTKRTHKISNLDMLPKLHKSKRHNEIIQKRQCAYINTKGNITVEACPIVAGPVHLTRGISEIFHIIMEPSLAMISHIAKDYFDFKNRLDKHCPTGPTLRACDIKSLCTKIRHDLFYTEVEYWVENCKMIYRYCDFQ